MTQPQPQLLSLLEKVANPITQLDLTLDLKGVYAPPEQWKNTDEANPDTFAYTLKILGQEFVSGKIIPRKLTQKQLKEQEQKNKKGGKKQTKQQQKPAEQVDPEEEQRKRLQWEALSEQQRFYRTQQDPYKAFSLQFQENHKENQLDQQAISSLQSQIDRNELQITLIRKPNMSQEDLAKLKKSKPKNLNLGELYEAVYKGKVSNEDFLKPGTNIFNQRVKMQFCGQVPDDGVKITAGECYVYFEVSTSQPLTPQVKQIKPQIVEVQPKFSLPAAKQAPSSIQKLKLQICRSIRAISLQYSSFFSKQKEHTTQQKRHANLSSISTLRLNQINKKKQVFLNEFINSGKFNILKDRIGKSIKSVVIQKFRKQKGTGNISKKEISQTLSELNLFFHEQFMKTIDQFMNSQNGTVHEDIALGYENARQARKQVVAPIVNQSQVERQTRLTQQYQYLFLYDKAQQSYMNLLQINNYNIQSKENYANFCLKCKRFDEAYTLFSQIAQQSQQPQHKLILATMMVNRERTLDAVRQLNQLIQSQTAKLDDKVLYNMLMCFMFEQKDNIKESEKYLAISQRYFKMKQNPNMKFHPQINPYEQSKPNIPKPQRYASQLSHAESQQIRLALVNHFANLKLYNLVQKCLKKLEESQKKSILEIQVCIFSDKHEEALQKIDDLLKRGDNIRNVDLLILKADTCYIAEKMFESQQILLTILQLKNSSSKALQIYLKLGYTYIHRKSWEDAKVMFQKATELKYNCSVAWLGLGIANLNLGNYDQAEEALNLNKIYNPLSHEGSTYQEEINSYYQKKGKREYGHSGFNMVSTKQ